MTIQEDLSFATVPYLGVTFTLYFTKNMHKNNEYILMLSSILTLIHRYYTKDLAFLAIMTFLPKYYF